MKTLVSLKCRCLREVLATHVAAVGFCSCVAHAVAQQALRVSEGLCAHLACEELFTSMAVDMRAKEDTSSEGFSTVGANVGQWSSGPVLQQLGRWRIVGGMCVSSSATLRFLFSTFLSTTHYPEITMTFLWNGSTCLSCRR